MGEDRGREKLMLPWHGRVGHCTVSREGQVVTGARTDCVCMASKPAFSIQQKSRMMRRCALLGDPRLQVRGRWTRTRKRRKWSTTGELDAK